ncbi:MAG TPA: permease [Candidatus Dormibacteraeota bacterium]
MIHVLSAVGDSLRMAFFMLWDTLWPLIFGFGLSGAVQAFVSRSEMQRVMGDHRPRTLGIAAAFGAASSSCSYAASAMAKSLFAKGADFTTAMVFMLASTNLVIELGLVLWILIGWQFAVSEYVGGIIMIALLALVARFFFRPALVERARQKLAGVGGSDRSVGHNNHEPVADQPHTVPLSRRLRSPAGWADAASYTMADLVMLRKEMVAGYLVAGFLAVLVPNAFWNAIFFHGHGVATSVENVIVGPLIAIISFVCSIGNVPLAAALWKGGISFGGVVSFIFADLITFPLLLIYRRFYGWTLTLRLLGAFWLVMAAAGLATEYLFTWAGLVPASRPVQVVQPALQWNYTTYLNLVFLGLFALLFWLYRNRERLGGGARYAMDPVCGMQVERALAPASLPRGTQTIYFCSDRCRERFTANPDRFSTQPSEQTETEHELRRPTMAEATDPVCGMTVDTQSAAAKRDYNGTTYYFCNPGCAKAFDRGPDTFVEASQTA